MERFTISLDSELARAFDQLIRERRYSTRSEAVRDILRAHLQGARERDDARGDCVACLSYVYAHHERELAERLTALQHAFHELTISAMHAHLDHEHCLETVLLRGTLQQVRQFADTVIAERGVRHGNLNLIHAERGPAHRRGGVTHVHLTPSH